MKSLCFLFAGVIAVLSAGKNWADTVCIRPVDEAPNSRPLIYEQVKVKGVAEGKLVFTNIETNSISKDFATVLSLRLDDEPILNSAEAAFSDEKFEQA